MVEFVTVWILTVTTSYTSGSGAFVDSYQLQYATQSICEQQRKNHIGMYKTTKCNFQQIPVYKKVKG